MCKWYILDKKMFNNYEELPKSIASQLSADSWFVL